ncbi:hypothetical protein HY469_00820 [Candidatus Roizmanbacteria bacterium]|nr:hypothetical protein [Candidatus Roizmanbacteria bacterium]
MATEHSVTGSVIPEGFLVPKSPEEYPNIITAEGAPPEWLLRHASEYHVSERLGGLNTPPLQKMTDQEKHRHFVAHESFSMDFSPEPYPSSVADVWVKFPYSPWHIMRLLRDYPDVENLQFTDVPPYEQVLMLTELFQDTAEAAVALVNNPETPVTESVIAVNGKRNKSFGPFHQHFIGIVPDSWKPIKPDELDIYVPHRVDLCIKNDGCLNAGKMTAYDLLSNFPDIVKGFVMNKGAVVFMELSDRLDIVTKNPRFLPMMPYLDRLLVEQLNEAHIRPDQQCYAIALIQQRNQDHGALVFQPAWGPKEPAGTMEMLGYEYAQPKDYGGLPVMSPDTDREYKGYGNYMSRLISRSRSSRVTLPFPI